MDYTCKAPFVGIIGGAEKRYAQGDTIPAKEAAEAGLSAKPDLAEKVAE